MPYLCSVIAIENTLISDELLERKFVCDLSACKGACCVEGESGAPLELEEIAILEDELDKIKPFLRPEGLKAIEKHGVFTLDSDGDFVTTLVAGAECAFATFDKNGVAKCGIEEANKAGATSFKKPVSCHLYPARLSEFKNYIGDNYHEWPICDAACELGAQLKVPVYVFLKEALTRRFGAEWYEQLCAADQFRQEQNAQQNSAG